MCVGPRRSSVYSTTCCLREAPAAVAATLRAVVSRWPPVDAAHPLTDDTTHVHQTCLLRGPIQSREELMNENISGLIKLCRHINYSTHMKLTKLFWNRYYKLKCRFIILVLKPYRYLLNALE